MFLLITMQWKMKQCGISYSTRPLHPTSPISCGSYVINVTHWTRWSSTQGELIIPVVCPLVLTHVHSASNRGKLNDFISELLDFFYYLHDIFNLGITALNEVLSDHLLQYLLLPQFITSLIPDRVTPHVEVSTNHSKLHGAG